MAAQGHILDANTAALWRFNNTPKGTRRIIRDVGPGGFHATAASLTLSALQRPFGPAGQAVRQSIGGAAFGDPPQTNHVFTTNSTIVAALKTSYTVEFFVMPNALSAGGRSICTLGASNALLLRVDLTSTGRLSIFWEVSGADQTMSWSTGSTMVDNTWYHCAIVKDAGASQVRFYLNGVLEQTVAKAAEPNAAGVGGNFGCNVGVNLGLRACIKDFKVVAGVKSAPDIATDAALLGTTFELPIDAGTLFHFRCDDDADIAFDETGKLPLVAGRLLEEPRVSHPLIADGGLGMQLFDKEMGTLTIGDVTGGLGLGANVDAFRLILQSAFTFEAWIDLANMSQPTGSPPGMRGLWCFGDPGQAAADRNFLTVDILIDGRIQWWSEFGIDADSIVTSTQTVPATGVFHLALRRNATSGGVHDVDMFINGVLVDTLVGIVPFAGGGNAAQRFFLGYGAAEDVNYFRGYVDDIRFSDIARSDAEILESYQRGIDFTAPSTAPTIAIISPDPNVNPGDPGGFPTDKEAAMLTPIVLEITAPDGLTFASVVARYPGDPIEHVIYRRGAFRGEFAPNGVEMVAGSTYTLTCLPVQGWPLSVALQDIIFDVDAIGGGAISDIGASS